MTIIRRRCVEAGPNSKRFLIRLPERFPQPRGWLRCVGQKQTRPGRIFVFSDNPVTRVEIKPITGEKV
jgi:hypothetical protein